MKIAITGGTGFVGSHLARVLSVKGHEVVLISRGNDERNLAIRKLDRSTFVPIGTNDEESLTRAFTGCDSVAHCAGINRQIGKQTYRNVHIDGTKRIVDAAKRAGVKKVVLLSFLRARPDCESGYHESKWMAEEIVRSSGLDYTVIKAGVIYGRGDHMLDHLSHAFYTFRLFAFVGIKDRAIAPLAIDDLVHILEASIIENRLSRQTIAVIGPEKITLNEAVQRVARVIGKRPYFIRMPVFFHYALAWVLERVMAIPLVSIAQVRILSEGIIDAEPPCASLPEDLKPRISFSEEQVSKGLPAPGGFGLKDLRL